MVSKVFGIVVISIFLGFLVAVVKLVSSRIKKDIKDEWKFGRTSSLFFLE